MNGMMRKASLVLLVAGLALVGREGALRIHGLVAGGLVERALSSYLRDGAPRRPWPWADFTPVARLAIPASGVRRAVLDRATGEAMAYGLGRAGRDGNVLVGHRDSWAAFLGDLRPGDAVELERPDGGVSGYVVDRAFVVRTDQPHGRAAPPPDALALVTCYPFDSIVPGPQRYVVVCRPSRG
jgi:sortase A